MPRKQKEKKPKKRKIRYGDIFFTKAGTPLQILGPVDDNPRIGLWDVIAFPGQKGEAHCTVSRKDMHRHNPAKRPRRSSAYGKIQVMVTS